MSPRLLRARFTANDSRLKGFKLSRQSFSFLEENHKQWLIVFFSPNLKFSETQESIKQLLKNLLAQMHQPIISHGQQDSCCDWEVSRECQDFSIVALEPHQVRDTDRHTKKKAEIQTTQL